jgi:putative transposase
MLPSDFPPWKTVFHYFRAWRIDGTWQSLNGAMRRRLREKLGRDPEPSAGIVDSQSAKTTGVGGGAGGAPPTTQEATRMPGCRERRDRSGL